mgnify:CR=1 FL=1|tara:strand:- start:431 stop:871 length:441 start_codon:yes stop_codon:yes gene_type:complete
MIWKQIDIGMMIKHSEKIGELLDGVVAASSEEFTKEQLVEALGKSHVAWAYFADDDTTEMDTIAVTTVVQYPTKKVMIVVGCAGDRKKQPWKDVITGINAMAVKFYQADAIEVKGRKAFAKIWGAEGFKEKYVVIERDVQPIEEGK